MFEIGMLVGGAIMFPPVVAVCMWLDRRNRIRLRVDQMPRPLPGAYERPPERVLAGPAPSTVVDGEVLTREE